ncbi:type VII secretion-associated serine protease mycosin [Tsukamurella strandjordii]|uniref:Type VII secretion-associated serine protease mycosin n=1 Tax=Tsukamurella strandjordii TaxID=147577 RepID=A0AA90NMC3_9ACTN|nr:type VII secretion-associated serine protease mycosin [Tsukamurella strandjordii]MDP0397129.1 type VII secretion-associated serine protease mycosin [Tsukamurella strandjordii]
MSAVVAVTAVVSLIGGWVPAASFAVVPPVADLGGAPPDTDGPERPLRYNNPRCVDPGILPNSNLAAAPAPSTTLRIDEAQKFSTGAGVTVAVLSTGVRPQARLRALDGAGDNMNPADRGLIDCDSTGTLVAGIVGAQPAAGDGFVGVAPDSRVLSIRVDSTAFSLQNSPADNEDPNASRAAVTARSIARAVVRAANRGARVIVIPEPVCMAADAQFRQREIGGAVAYATQVKDALVIAGAGATDRKGSNGGGNDCKANPDPDPGSPDDPRGWRRVSSVATPNWFDGLVLSVGATTAEGAPLPGSLNGPWLDVAAPGAGLVSLNSRVGDGVVNGLPSERTLVPFAGPEFAAAYVAGTAALVRARYPQMRAKDVAARIVATAHAPGRGTDNKVGRGLIDPVAALTAKVPEQGVDIDVESVEKLLLPPPAPSPDTRPRQTAAIVAGVGLAIVIVLAAVVALVRPRRTGKRRTS